MVNEKRLIDANACPCIKCDSLGNCRPGLCSEFAEWWLCSMDAVEVVHGRWVDNYTNIICSVCGAEYSDEIIFMNRNFKYENLCYCPNCGAKMDLEESTNDD